MRLSSQDFIPPYPQSNEKIEATVKSMKKLVESMRITSVERLNRNTSCYVSKENTQINVL